MSGYWPQTDEVGTSLAPPIAAGPPTGLGENYDAAVNDQMMVNNGISRDILLSNAYDDRVNEVYKATGQKLDNPVYGGEEEALFKNGLLSDKIVNQHITDFEGKVDALRAQYPALSTPQDMWKNLSYMAKSVDADTANISDRATVLGKIGSFAGQMSGALTDPVNLVTLPFGAPESAGILKTAAIEGGYGATIEGAIQPGVQRFRKELGMESGVVPALENVAGAAGGRAVLGAGIKTIAKGLETPTGQMIKGAVSDTAAAIQNMTGNKLVSLFDKVVPNPTPEQSLARDMQAHINDVNDQSPLDPAAPGAIEEHNQRLTESMNALQTETAPDMPETPAAPLSQETLDTAPGQLDGLMQNFDPANIQTDAKTFQFKEGGDASGVTDRLQGVQQWDPVKGGMVIVYENNAGDQFIADGHQRLGLAQRIQAQDPNAAIKLYGPLFREADGYTPETVRVIAAMKNIAEGTGTAVDAAKVLRVDPARISELPGNSQLVRQAGDMVNLTDNAFSYVINEQVPANQGAIVGRLVKDSGMQDAIIGLLAKVEPENVAQAEAIVRQAMDAGLHTETQHSLFGEEQVTSSLYLERAKVLDKTLKKLKMEGKVFQTLVDNADRIQNEGNILNAATNAARAETDGRAVQMVQTLANRKGPLSDALTAAARRAADEGRYSNATNDFVTAVRSSAERGDFNGLQAGGNGSAAETALENKPRSSHPAETPQDEKTLKLFDEPGGQGSRDQARALEADIKREAGIDKTSQGDQLVIPGAEKKSLQDVADQKAGEKIKPTAAQQAANEGLFDVAGRGQSDLLDQQIPVGEHVDENGNVVSETKSVRQLLEEMDGDAKDLEAIGKCGIP